MESCSSRTLNENPERDAINTNELASHFTAFFAFPNAPTNTSISAFLPGFVQQRNMATSHPQLTSFNLKYDESAKRGKCTITWNDTTDEAVHAWRSLVFCDGPCGKYVRSDKIVQFGDCEHNVCEVCMRKPLDNPELTKYANVCCRNACCLEAISPRFGMPLSHISKRVPLTSDITNRSSSSNNRNANALPAEMINVKISVLERTRLGVERVRFERDIPSSYILMKFKAILATMAKDLDHSVVCYSLNLPRSRIELMPLVLNNSNGTLGQLMNGKNVLWMVVIGQRVQL